MLRFSLKLSAMARAWLGVRQNLLVIVFLLVVRFEVLSDVILLLLLHLGQLAVLAGQDDGSLCNVAFVEVVLVRQTSIGVGVIV